jgi:hypothetical protein
MRAKQNKEKKMRADIETLTRLIETAKVAPLWKKTEAVEDALEIAIDIFKIMDKRLDDLEERLGHE